MVDTLWIELKTWSCWEKNSCNVLWHDHWLHQKAGRIVSYNFTGFFKASLILVLYINCLSSVYNLSCLLIVFLTITSDCLCLCQMSGCQAAQAHHWDMGLLASYNMFVVNIDCICVYPNVVLICIFNMFIVIIKKSMFCVTLLVWCGPFIPAPFLLPSFENS